MSSRSWGWLRKSLVVSILAGLGPACGSPSDSNLPPIVIATSPTAVGGVVAGSVPRWRIFYIKFDRALDPATVDKTTIYITPDAVFGPVDATVTYNDVVHEVRLVTTTPLTGNTVYDLLVTTAVKSSKGTAVQALQGIQFTTANPGSANAPAFAGPISPIPPGDITTSSIKVSWAAATDPDASTVTYDVWMATTANGQDFTRVSGPDASVTTLNTTIMSLTSATTYYFKVVARNAAGNMDINTVEVSATTN